MNALSPPIITDAPAPWTLQGQGYITLLRFRDGGAEQDRFLPDALSGQRGRSPYAWMMFVDYRNSAVGPYHELLFIPGNFPFADGRRHLSISRIFVSSMDSVVNGQRNWGIPKDVAQFDVRYNEGGLDRVKVSQGGKLFAELDFRSYPLWLPFLGGLVPRGLRTLGQRHDDRTFIYAPSADGWIKPARLVRAWSDPALFPDLAAARPVITVAIPRFRMSFPVANII